MIIVGEKDVFERMYMEKFRAFASSFGEFVSYEHDRGARDIGLHLTQRFNSGKERLSSALCWFQMKGVMESTLSKVDFNQMTLLKISLKVEHLRYWLVQPMPTYLVVYIESADVFLILNIQKYVSEKWGREIFKLGQKTISVEIPKESILDKQAFRLILQESDVDEWTKVLGAKEEEIKVCRRDYDLIWHLATAEKRCVEHQIRFMDWQSKARSQFYIQERPKGTAEKWHTLREHWQYMMDVFDLEELYPYVEFYAHEPDDDLWYDEDEYKEAPDWVLDNGDVVFGADACGEYFEYIANMRLNDMGKQMYELVCILEEIGLIEISQGCSEYVSVAPWHGRKI